MFLGLTKKNFELDFEYDYICLMWWLSAKSFEIYYFHIFYADMVFQIAFGYLGKRGEITTSVSLPAPLF
jgi:hypothetical protein